MKSNIVRVIKTEMDRSCSHNGNGRNAFEILTDKPTGKIPLERPWRRWEDNIRMDLKNIGINTTN